MTSNAPKAHGGRKAVGAAMWLLTGFGGAQILRLAGNLILTRLLFAEAFGVMQLVTVFIVGLHLFSDIGIGPSIVQSPHGDDPKFLNTAWTLQIVRGVALSTIGVALSYPFALYFDAPEIFPLLVAANAVSLFGGFQSTKVFTASRNLGQRRLSLLELGAQTLSMIATVVCAYIYREVWTLVISSLLYDLLRTLGSHFLLPGEKNRIEISRPYVGEMMRFGRWIFVSTLLTFCVTQADRLIFGKMVPLDMLGIYGIAAGMVAMAPTALGSLSHGILFPVYARIVQRGDDLPLAFGRARRPVLIVAAWIMAGFIAGGETMIELLYDARYQQAGLIVQILSLGAFFAVLESSTSKALLALGDSHLMAAASLGKLVGMVLFIPLGYHFGGFLGACAGYSASELGRYAVSTYSGRIRSLSALGLDMRLILLLIAASLFGYVTVGFAKGLLPGLTPVHALVVFVSVSLPFAPLFRGLLGEFRSLRQS